MKVKMLVAMVACAVLVSSVQAGMWQDVVREPIGNGQFSVTGTGAFWSNADGVLVMERLITFRNPLVKNEEPVVDFMSNSPEKFNPAVVVEAHPEWLQSLSVSDAAQWVSVTKDGSTDGIDTASGLYAIMINNNQQIDVETGKPQYVGAYVSLYFTADNFLGGNGMTALYFNGAPVTEDDNGLFGNFETAAVQLFKKEFELHFSVELQPGENWLYLDATSFYGPAGVIFYGTVNYYYVEAPEPMSMSLLAMGAVGMLIRRKR